MRSLPSPQSSNPILVMCMCMCMSTVVCMCMCMCLYVYVDVAVCEYMQVYVYVCACMYLYFCDEICVCELLSSCVRALLAFTFWLGSRWDNWFLIDSNPNPCTINRSTKQGDPLADLLFKQLLFSSQFVQPLLRLTLECLRIMLLPPFLGTSVPG